MNVISILFGLYEKVRANINMPSGTIFDYTDSDYNGLKIIAEVMARARAIGMSTLFIPTSSVANIFINPTTKYKHTFQLDNKLDRLYEDGHYFLAIQYESELDSGNYLLVRIDEAGNKANIYTVHKQRSEPTPLTEVYFDYDDDIRLQLQRLYRMAISELSIMLENKNAGSKFGDL